jgi:hypothetical protein
MKNLSWLKTLTIAVAIVVGLNFVPNLYGATNVIGSFVPPLAVVNGGTNNTDPNIAYTDVPTVNTSAQATLPVTTGNAYLTSATVAAGGTGYTASSTFNATVSGGTGIAAVVNVTTNASGVVTAVNAVGSPGSYTAAPSPLTGVATTGGSGTGLTLNLTMNTIAACSGNVTPPTGTTPNSSNTFICLMTNNITLENPSNMVPGTDLDMFFFGNPGPYTLTFAAGSYYLYPTAIGTSTITLPQPSANNGMLGLTTGSSNKADELHCRITNTNYIACDAVLNNLQAP